MAKKHRSSRPFGSVRPLYLHAIMQPRTTFLLAAFTLLLAPSVARGDPRAPSYEDTLQDALDDGDVDGDDFPVLASRTQVGASPLHGGSWVSLVGFANQLMSGRNDFGGMVVVGLALDRIGAGSTHRIGDPSRAVPAAPPPPATPPQPSPLVAPSLARECVAAALRTSGLGVDDSRIDALVSRARASAWLPETRARAMRLMTDAAHATTVAATDGTSYYEAIGANLVFELRLTWRFDRLLYAGDEPGLERTRLLRQQARSHLATRTLEVLFAWQRGVVEAQQALAGTQEELEARLHESEARATLDVLTDGWFSRRGGP